MKEITPEIKERIIALYWGQYIMMFPDNDDRLKVSDWFNFKRACLELTPLSQITDEDAIEVAKMFGWLRVTGHWEVYKNQFMETVVKTFGESFDKYGVCAIEVDRLNINQIDFLRSRGYALPAFGYSVDDLVEAGVFKLKDN